MEQAQDARDVALRFHDWAKKSGVLFNGAGATNERVTLFAPEDQDKLQRGLASAHVTGILFDNENAIVTVLTKTAIASKAKHFPDSIGNVEINYIGQAVIEANPPAIPHASQLAVDPWHLHNNRFACGSSVTSAPDHGAGTMGCLVRNQSGELCGLTNNHVTGACNHTVAGMHIIMPAPMDAQPHGPAPVAIGRHHSFAPLHSGDPQQMRLQQLDAALFTVNDEDRVTSMQGAGFYDTPNVSISLTGKMRVKKVGRTTGLTTGTILGQFATPLALPYNAQHFKSTVYFDHPWLIKGDSGAFSQPGDSGSLVVTEDGQFAVGVIFAGLNGLSAIIPIDIFLSSLGLTLVSGHQI